MKRTSEKAIRREEPKYILEIVRATTCARAVAGAFGSGIPNRQMIVKLNYKVPDGKGGLKPRKKGK